MFDLYIIDNQQITPPPNDILTHKKEKNALESSRRFSTFAKIIVCQ